MDFVPTQDVKYDPYDELTVVCHIDTHVRLVYQDWQGVEQERCVGRGTWPLKSTMLLGYKTMDPQNSNNWSARLDLSDAGNGIEFSVGRSASMDLPRQMRRGR